MNSFLILAAIATIPLLVGMAWYNPKTFGNAWMQSAGLSRETMKPINMPLVYGLVYLCSLLLAVMIHTFVVHQDALGSLVGGDPSTLAPDLKAHYEALAEATKGNFRTFKHGVFHGIIASIFFVLPIISVSALFEQRGAKYIFIHFGFWLVSIALMGGFLCQFA